MELGFRHIRLEGIILLFLQLHLFSALDRIHDVNGILKIGIAGDLPDHIDGPDPFAGTEQRLDLADVWIVGQRSKGLGCGGDFDGALAVGAFHAAQPLGRLERGPAGRAIQGSNIFGHAPPTRNVLKCRIGFDFTGCGQTTNSSSIPARLKIQLAG